MALRAERFIPSPRIRRRLRRALYVILFVLTALAGAVTAVSLLGVSRYAWRGFQVELRLVPATEGQTRLVFTPLGEVHAHTHVAPVALVASLEQIEVDKIRALVDNKPTRDALADDFERTARGDLRQFILRQLLIATLGGLLAPILLRCHRVRQYAVGGIIGLVVVGAVLGSALSTFNGRAFDSPIYTGALKQAPWIIQFGKDAFGKIEALSQKLRTVAVNLNVLYGRIASLPDSAAPGDSAGTFRVLHVSDLHNNAAALQFISEVAHQFHVAYIIDTGDLTDFGSPPETVMVQGIAKLPYPYAFVLGNHDSHTVEEALTRAPNVILLNGSVVQVKGMSILGLANPASQRASVGSVDASPAELVLGGGQLLRTANSLPIPPDIVAVHDPAESVPLWGHVPLILVGHEHRYYVETEGDASLSPGSNPPTRQPAYHTVVCNAGTTGAAGLRYFEKEKGVPFSCAVLTFQRPPPRPAAPSSAMPVRPAAVASLPAAPRQAGTAAGPLSTPYATAVYGPVQPPLPPRRPQLRTIDLIVLNGSFGEYSISHYTFR